MADSKSSGGLLASAAGAAMGLALLWWGHSKEAEANALSQLKIEKIASILGRANASGDAAELAAIRGYVVIPPGVEPVPVAGLSATDTVVVCDEDYILRKVAVNPQTGKLVEKSEFFKTRRKEASEWLVQDETGAATLSDSFHPSLEAGPGHYEPVRAGFTPEILIGNDGSVAVRDKRDRERIVGVETVRHILKAGTLLTVVGRATVDGKGVLRFTASASSPLGAIADTRTLGQLIDDAKSGVGFLKKAGWVCLGAASAFLLYRAAQSLLDNGNKSNDGARSDSRPPSVEEDPMRPPQH